MRRTNPVTPQRTRISEVTSSFSGWNGATLPVNIGQGEFSSLVNMVCWGDKVRTRPGLTLDSAYPNLGTKVPGRLHVHVLDGVEWLFFHDLVGWGIYCAKPGDSSWTSVVTAWNSEATLVSCGRDVFALHALGNRVLQYSATWQYRAMGMSPPTFSLWVDEAGGYSPVGYWSYAVESVWKESGVVVRSSSPHRVPDCSERYKGNKVFLSLDITGRVGTMTHIRVWRSMDQWGASGNRSELYFVKEISIEDFQAAGNRIRVDDVPDASMGELYPAEDLEMVPIPACSVGTLVSGRLWISGATSSGMRSDYAACSGVFPSPNAELLRPIQDYKSFAGQSSYPVVGLAAMDGDLFAFRKDGTMRLANGNPDGTPYQVAHYSPADGKRYSVVAGVGLVMVCADGRARILSSSLGISEEIGGKRIPEAGLYQTFTGVFHFDGRRLWMEVTTAGSGTQYGYHVFDTLYSSWADYSFSATIPRLRMVSIPGKSLGFVVGGSCYRIDADNENGTDGAEPIGWHFIPHHLVQADGFCELWAVLFHGRAANPVYCRSFSDGNFWSPLVAFVGNAGSNAGEWQWNGSDGVSRAPRCIGADVSVMVSGSGFCELTRFQFEGFRQSGPMKPGWSPLVVKQQWDALHG